MIFLADRTGQLGNRVQLLLNWYLYAHHHKHKLLCFNISPYNNLFPQLKNKDVIYYNYRTNSIKTYKLPNTIIKSIFYFNDKFKGKLINKTYSKICFYNTFIDNYNIMSSQNIDKKKILWVYNFSMPPTINHKSYHFEELRALFGINESGNSNFPFQTQTLGVHIRGKDYKKFRNGEYYYSIQEYKALMFKIIKETSHKINFIISSDEDLSNEFNELKNCYYMPNNTLVDDLYLLSKCNAIIGPPSTFSQTAAFIGNTKVYFISRNTGKVEIVNYNELLKELS